MLDPASPRAGRGKWVLNIGQDRGVCRALFACVFLKERKEKGRVYTRRPGERGQSRLDGPWAVAGSPADSAVPEWRALPQHRRRASGPRAVPRPLRTCPGARPAASGRLQDPKQTNPKRQRPITSGRTAKLNPAKLARRDCGWLVCAAQIRVGENWRLPFEQVALQPPGGGGLGEGTAATRGPQARQCHAHVHAGGIHTWVCGARRSVDQPSRLENQVPSRAWRGPRAERYPRSVQEHFSSRRIGGAGRLELRATPGRAARVQAKRWGGQALLCRRGFASGGHCEFG